MALKKLFCPFSTASKVIFIMLFLFVRLAKDQFKGQINKSNKPQVQKHFWDTFGISSNAQSCFICERVQLNIL